MRHLTAGIEPRPNMGAKYTVAKQLLIWTMNVSALRIGLGPLAWLGYFLKIKLNKYFQKIQNIRFIDNIEIKLMNHYRRQHQ